MYVDQPNTNTLMYGMLSAGGTNCTCPPTHTTHTPHDTIRDEKNVESGAGSYAEVDDLHGGPHHPIGLHHGPKIFLYFGFGIGQRTAGAQHGIRHDRRIDEWCKH